MGILLARCVRVRRAEFDWRSQEHVLLMSALPPKADMCSAQAHVCFGPIADIALLFTPPLRPAKRGEKDGQTGVK